MRAALFPMVQAISAGGVGAMLVAEVVRALRTGEARGRLLGFKRREEPVLYWLIVSVQIAAVLACVVVIVLAWRDFLTQRG